VAWHDLFYVIDLIFVIVLFIMTKSNWYVERMNIRKPAIVLLTGVVAFSINLRLAEADRPDLLRRTFDRNYLVKNFEDFNFTIYDAVKIVKSSTQHVMADSRDKKEV